MVPEPQSQVRTRTRRPSILIYCYYQDSKITQLLIKSGKERSAEKGKKNWWCVQDEAEADGGGLRVPEALLRDAHRGEPAAAEGAGGAARAQDGAPLLHAPPGHHPVHVSLLRARRLRLHLRPRRRRAGSGRLLVPIPRGRGRHCGGPAGAEALVVLRAVLVPTQPPAGRPASAAGAGELVRPPPLVPTSRPLSSGEANEGPACKCAHLFFSSSPFLRFHFLRFLVFFVARRWVYQFRENPMGLARHLAVRLDCGRSGC